jgi:hypothetical protein
MQWQLIPETTMHALDINTLLTIIEIISMSGINSGHHNLPTYEMSLKSDNVEFVQYCGGHFENGDR